jgi:TPP-dependent pyruvate/acetoin dehydrogenase alpha subunit
MSDSVINVSEETPELPLTSEEIIADYRLAYRSRQASLIGRREVMSGKAKFGIFGDGKEVTQLAIARTFRKGDWRSGYYRDQTWMFALGVLTLREYFAQLYAHADVESDPATAGRSMNAHFASRYLNPDGSWKNQTEMHNVSADVSPTGSQMPRLVGLAYASRLYRELDDLASLDQFSRNGDEIAWGSIGNASKSRRSSVSTMMDMGFQCPTNSRWSKRAYRPFWRDSNVIPARQIAVTAATIFIPCVPGIILLC